MYKQVLITLATLIFVCDGSSKGLAHYQMQEGARAAIDVEHADANLLLVLVEEGRTRNRLAYQAKLKEQRLYAQKAAESRVLKVSIEYKTMENDSGNTEASYSDKKQRFIDSKVRIREEYDRYKIKRGARDQRVPFFNQHGYFMFTRYVIECFVLHTYPSLPTTT
ncbi:MAG: hypothetical protein IPF79_04920 [Ignavibacteria bacterium]|nr:hypothetical protein [Ignavibacteria bacterium]